MTEMTDVTLNDPDEDALHDGADPEGLPEEPTEDEE
jgi:hypothetical protein